MTEKSNYSDNRSKAAEFLRLTIALLAKYQIPTHPHNYQMGYEYVSGKNQSLIDDLDKLFGQSKSPEDNQLQSLYKQYFLQDEAFLEAMRQEIRLIISSILKEFNYSGGKLSDYSQTLNRYVDILDNHHSSAELLEETHRVIEETQATAKSQHRVELQMTSVIAEIDSLRKELEQVKEESKIDSLTGISNRKAFDAALEHTILTSRETKKPFCLLLLDIDHFKTFNDTFGHLVGDKVLRYVAASLKRSIKGGDFVARFGGEEFAIILPATSINSGMIVAEQIRKAVSSGTLTDKATDTSYGKTMISIGVTQFRASDLSNELVDRADKALYLAKDRGRDRVEKL